MKIFLKWLLYMIPAFIGQGIIMYFFRPHTLSSLAVGTPIFLLLSLGNLIVYNFLFVPEKLRSRIKDFILGRSLGGDGAGDYEDILVQIINDSKTRQAAFNGYLRVDLVRLHDEVVKKEIKFRTFSKLGQWLTYLFILAVTAYNLLIPGFQISIIYLEWGLGLFIVTTSHVFGRRYIHWGYQKVTLKRCLEKCKEQDRFQFDDDI